MKDRGFPKGLIKRFDTRIDGKNFDGITKLFIDYLNNFNVPFFNACCPNSNDSGLAPVGFNTTTQGFSYTASDGTVVSVGSSQSVTGLTAHATGGQGSATQLAPGYNKITVSATAGDSVKLPAAAEGIVVIVKNDGVAAADVFPTAADSINSLAINLAVRIAPQSTITFRAIDAIVWEADNEVVSTNTISEQTSASGVTVDGLLIKDGGASANSMFAAFYPTAAAQALSGAGAVNVTSYLTKFTSTAANALTIAAGSQIGQRKRISHVVDGGSGILTGTFVGGTTITFTTVAEFADLLWTGAAWAVLELGNSATPGTPPALS